MSGAVLGALPYSTTMSSRVLGDLTGQRGQRPPCSLMQGGQCGHTERPEQSLEDVPWCA